jgi:hypothetical protein
LASPRRSERVDRLEALCGKIAARVEAGESVSVACRKVARHAGRRRIAGASFQNLHRLFNRWAASGRQREALSDRYSIRRKVNASLAAHFAGVALRPATGNLRQAYRAVVVAWKRGAALPGLGSWLPHPRGRGLSRRHLSNPPPFPVSYDALLQYLSRADLAAFREQRARVDRARQLSRESLRRSRHQLAVLRSQLIAVAAQRGEGLKP